MQDILELLSNLINRLTNANIDLLLKLLIYPLTVLNTWLVVQEKLRKPKLDLDIEYSALCRRGEYLDFKIDLLAIARNEDVYLKEVFIFNKSRPNLFGQFNELWFESLTYYSYDGPQYTGPTWNLQFQPPINKVFLEKAVKQGKCKYSGDISDQNIEVFKGFKEDIWCSLRTEDWEQGIVGLRVVKNSVLSLTLLGELGIAKFESEEHYKNSSEKVPASGWYLCCDYGVGRITKKLHIRTRNL